MLLLDVKFLKTRTGINMLIPDNIHPNQSIYYNGAFVLEAIRDHGIQKMLDLYHNVKNKKNMTFPIFVLCLDWLFLLDLIVLNEDGEIELCT